MTCKKCKVEMKRDDFPAAKYTRHTCPVCLSRRIIVYKVLPATNIGLPATLKMEVKK